MPDAIVRTSTPTDAAKAAALLCFTSCVPNSKKALDIYNLLAECAGSGSMMLTVLEEQGSPTWEVVEHLPIEDWWDNVVSLALSIDACQQELKKEPIQ